MGNSFVVQRRQLPQQDRYTDELGVELGQRWTAIESVGLYVPGGTASYPSSVLMNAVPAKVAGVAKVLHASADRAFQLLTEHREQLDKLAQALIEREELDVNEITELIGPAVYTQGDGNGHRDATVAAKGSVHKSDL